MRTDGRRKVRLAGAAALLLAASVSPSAAGEWRTSGLLGIETRGFTGDPAYPGQMNGLQESLLLAPEIRFRTDTERHQLTLAPFLRLDGADDERTHADLRQAYWRYVGDAWELLAGADRVYWGVTESRHLVDVINQVDAIEDIDEEDRLGQPMVAATFLPDWGTISLYALAGFRERTFPGQDGRLRAPLVVDTDHPVYESGAEDSRVDLALRYAHVLGDWDVGAHLFSGTSREPRLLPDATGAALLPHYDLMNQIGVDLQYTREAWLWKLEGIVRETRLDDYGALVGGVEYTLYQIGDSAADLGLLVEYLYDGRDDLTAPPTLFDDDLFVGSRLALNDIQNSEGIFGLILDRDLGSKAVFVEIERRLGTAWTLEVEGRFLTSVDDEDPMALLKNDDFVTIRLSWNL
jgi:hypothetical protein